MAFINPSFSFPVPFPNNSTPTPQPAPQPQPASQPQPSRGRPSDLFPVGAAILQARGPEAAAAYLRGYGVSEAEIREFVSRKEPSAAPPRVFSLGSDVSFRDLPPLGNLAPPGIPLTFGDTFTPSTPGNPATSDLDRFRQARLRFRMPGGG